MFIPTYSRPFTYKQLMVKPYKYGMNGEKKTTNNAGGQKNLDDVKTKGRLHKSL